MPTCPAVTCWLCCWIAEMTSCGISPRTCSLFGSSQTRIEYCAGAEHGDVADAGQSRQLVANVDGGVIAEEQTVIGRVRRGQRHEQQDRGGPLLHGDALVLHRLRQLRQRARYPVLHQHLREVEVGADLEGDRQRIGAVGAAIGLHVEHVLDAVDLLLDRQRDGIDHGLGAGAGIAGRDLHGRRHDVGILRDRKAEQAHAADQDHQDRDDVGKDRPFDEEFRNHGQLLLGRCRRRFDLLAAADRPSGRGSRATGRR